MMHVGHREAVVDRLERADLAAAPDGELVLGRGAEKGVVEAVLAAEIAAEVALRHQAAGRARLGPANVTASGTRRQSRPLRLAASRSSTVLRVRSYGARSSG